ncbi:octaheme c-type cytochrome, tetrathionate reductase family [Desulfonauticus submarinus]|uniref:Octaheme c-type cytochrome, tetrathionate reductase family n=2 Tax=Desulfonauticus submarinus TaxID=206665 RepID=A0A1H0DKL6_9BACT|nr:octaheme c-type cytochrome, tetrathionate reductase family [Desulfonauticus submarinus]
MSKIDCLICHDRTGSYKKAPPKAGMPDPKVDLVYVAQNVGQPTRKNCGYCHFSGGGGDAVKHADLNSALFWPKRTCDVHMGGYGFECIDCHRTRQHKISGRSMSAPVAEGGFSCEDCHSKNPHYGNNLLDHHLNKHCETIACNTCHSPVYSKCVPTKVWWDWSTAGNKKRGVEKGKYGKPVYHFKKGSFRWKESAKPEYAWFNGYVKRMFFGDKIDPRAKGFTDNDNLTFEQKQKLVFTNIIQPVGSINDPNSKITPFKVMRGIQGADAEYRYLLVPHLFPYNKEDKTAYWKSFDWHKSFAEGMKKAGLKYSGKYIWVGTKMYWRIEHEVMPKEFALSCVQCHESLKGERTCDRCHQDNRNVDFKKLAFKGTDFKYMHMQGRDVKDLIGQTDYINFKALGYKGDPIIYGGRFKKLPLGYKK